LFSAFHFEHECGEATARINLSGISSFGIVFEIVYMALWYLGLRLKFNIMAKIEMLTPLLLLEGFGMGKAARVSIMKF
jgi:hypothetical protein